MQPASLNNIKMALKTLRFPKMIPIRKTIVVLVSLLQLTQAYCVYNRLTNSTSLPTFINVYAVNRTLK